MIPFLRLLFLVVLVSMLCVISWASLQCPLFAVPRDVFAHPWFIATMADTYWGFITFFVWVCYKQTSWLSRAAWFLAIMLLGNIAMSSFCLRELFRVPGSALLLEPLTRRNAAMDVLGPLLAVLGAAVVLLALPRR